MPSVLELVNSLIESCRHQEELLICDTSTVARKHRDEEKEHAKRIRILEELLKRESKCSSTVAAEGNEVLNELANDDSLEHFVVMLSLTQRCLRIHDVSDVVAEETQLLTGLLLAVLSCPNNAHAPLRFARILPDLNIVVDFLQHGVPMWVRDNMMQVLIILVTSDPASVLPMFVRARSGCFGVVDMLSSEGSDGRLRTAAVQGMKTLTNRRTIDMATTAVDQIHNRSHSEYHADIGIQMAFVIEDAFEKLFGIIKDEGGSSARWSELPDGCDVSLLLQQQDESLGVVLDCVTCIQNLIINNKQTSQLFLQMGHLHKFAMLLEIPSSHLCGTSHSIVVPPFCAYQEAKRDLSAMKSHLLDKIFLQVLEVLFDLDSAAGEGLTTSKFFQDASFARSLSTWLVLTSSVGSSFSDHPARRATELICCFYQKVAFGSSLSSVTVSYVIQHHPLRLDTQSALRKMSVVLLPNVESALVTAAAAGIPHVLPVLLHVVAALPSCHQLVVDCFNSFSGDGAQEVAFSIISAVLLAGSASHDEFPTGLASLLPATMRSVLRSSDSIVRDKLGRILLVAEALGQSQVADEDVWLLVLRYVSSLCCSDVSADSPTTLLVGLILAQVLHYGQHVFLVPESNILLNDLIVARSNSRESHKDSSIESLHVVLSMILGESIEQALQTLSDANNKTEVLSILAETLVGKCAPSLAAALQVSCSILRPTRRKGLSIAQHVLMPVLEDMAPGIGSASLLVEDGLRDKLLSLQQQLDWQEGREKNLVWQRVRRINIIFDSFVDES